MASNMEEGDGRYQVKIQVGASVLRCAAHFKNPERIKVCTMCRCIADVLYILDNNISFCKGCFCGQAGFDILKRFVETGTHEREIPPVELNPAFIDAQVQCPICRGIGMYIEFKDHIQVDHPDIFNHGEPQQASKAEPEDSSVNKAQSENYIRECGSLKAVKSDATSHLQMEANFGGRTEPSVEIAVCQRCLEEWSCEEIFEHAKSCTTERIRCLQCRRKVDIDNYKQHGEHHCQEIKQCLDDMQKGDDDHSSNSCKGDDDQGKEPATQEAEEGSAEWIPESEVASLRKRTKELEERLEKLELPLKELLAKLRQEK